MTEQCDNPSPQGWTLDTLEKHFSQRIDDVGKREDAREKIEIERFSAAKERVDLALASSEKAISKAESADDKRFDSVNEFRKALTDLVATYLPRTEYSVQHTALSEKLDALGAKLSALTSENTGRTRGVSVVGMIVLGCLTGLASLAAVGAFLFAIFHK